MPPPPAAAVRNQRVASKERRDGKLGCNYNNNVDRGEYNHREGNTQSTLKREFLSRHGGGSSDVHRTSQNSCQFDQSGSGDMARNPGFFLTNRIEKGFLKKGMMLAPESVVLRIWMIYLTSWRRRWCSVNIVLNITWQSIPTLRGVR